MDNGAENYRRFCDGDDDGIVAIIKEYQDGLIFFLNRYVNNIHVAEDLAEDTFVQLATKKPRFTATYSFKTWLYTVGRNKALNHLKRARREPLSMEEVSSLQADGQLTESRCLKEELQQQINHALAQLPPAYRMAIHLKFFDALSNEQIAKIMKKSKRQVENLLYNAKKALKAELLKEGFCNEEL